MTGKNPNYRETVEKLRKALIGHAPNGDNLLKPDQQAAVRDALAMLTAQADELATLREVGQRLAVKSSQDFERAQAAEKELATLRAASTRRSMETAPKDGTWILLVIGAELVVARWGKATGMWVAARQGSPIGTQEPSAWMSLQEPTR